MDLNINVGALNLEDERMGLPSASAADRLAHCPGSWRMEKGQPQLARYAALADTGTKIHKLLAGDESVDARPSERETAAQMALARDALISKWRGALGESGELTITKETREFLRASLVPVTSGQWDFLARCGAHALIGDYKTGWQDLPMTGHNLQLRVYALIAFGNWPELESVSVAIIRPGDEDPFFHTYRVADLEAAWFWWASVLRMVFSESPPLVSGSHCQFCKAQFTCPARIAAVAEHEARAVGAVAAWESLSVQERADLYLRAKNVKQIAESIMDRTREDLESGIELPGLVIGKGRAKVEIEDSQAAYARAVSAGLTHEQIMATVSMSFAQLRDALRKAKGWKVKEAGDNAKALLSGLVVESTTKGSIEAL